MELVAGWFEGDPVAHLDGLEEIAATTGATVQAFDARYVVSRRHLERAVELADRAIGRGAAVADDRAVEILLYAAGRRQIDRALEMGLKAGDHPAVVVIDGGDEAAAARAVEGRLRETASPDGALADEGLIAAFFGVTDAERGTGADLESLVLERVALLTIDK